MLNTFLGIPLVSYLYSLILFFIGLIIPSIPKNIATLKIKRLFEYNIKSKTVKVVYSLIFPIENKTIGRPFAKKLHSNKKTITMPIPYEVVPYSVVKGMEYFLQEFSNRNKMNIIICDDTKVSDIEEGSFLCIGGPEYNDFTRKIMDSNSPVYFFRNPGDPYASIMCRKSRIVFSRRNEKGHDFGIIMKVHDSLKKRSYIICAGIGNLGTSGSLCFFSKHWESIYKKYKGREFAIIVDVKNRDDFNTTIVHYEEQNLTNASTG